MKKEVSLFSSEFKGESYFNIEECTLIQARGFIIQSLIEVETLIDRAITKWLSLTKEKEIVFYDVFLNTSIIETGKKAKILRALEIISEKEYSKIMELLNIRNAFAHANVISHITVIVNKEKEDIKIDDVSSNMKIMKNGLIKVVPAKELMRTFVKKKSEIKIRLMQICFNVKAG